VLKEEIQTFLSFSFPFYLVLFFIFRNSIKEGGRFFTFFIRETSGLEGLFFVKLIMGGEEGDSRGKGGQRDAQEDG